LPPFDEKALRELLSQLETNFSLIRSTLSQIKIEEITVTNQLCGKLIHQLQTLLIIIQTEEENVKVHRDNIAAKFMVCVDLYQKMTKTYYISHARVSFPHVKPLF